MFETPLFFFFKKNKETFQIRNFFRKKNERARETVHFVDGDDWNSVGEFIDAWMRGIGWGVAQFYREG
jgi:hypothetical protein